MQINRYWMLVVLFIFVIVGNTFAQKSGTINSSVKTQTNSFDDNDLYKLIDESKQKIEGKTFRYTNIKEKFEDGKNTPTEFNKYISENIPPDREYSIFEKKTPNGIERKEYIDIGRERFIRENGGKWKVFVPSGRGMGSGSGNGNEVDYKVESKEEKKLIRGEIIKGQKVDRYEKVVNYTYTYPNKVEKQTITTIYWFNSEGLLVKKLYEKNYETKKIIDRTTDTYEYNLKLKIEKPKIN